MRKRAGDIDAFRSALRPRMKGLDSSGPTLPPTLPAHQHSADKITFEPTEGSGGHMAADDVQEAIEELDSEKLARDGSQTMLGNLDMATNDVQNVFDLQVLNDADVGNDLDVGQDVRVVRDADVGRDLDVTRKAFVGDDLTMSGGVGDADFSGARTVHLVGDEADGEGRVDGVNAVVLQTVTPGSVELGRVSLVAEEGTLAMPVTSGATLFAVALGWNVAMCFNGEAD